MKKYMFKLFLLSFMCSFMGVMTACEEEIQRPEVVTPLMPDKGPEGTVGTIGSAEISQTVVFNSGAGNEVYRIPSVVTANDGSVLVFAEHRHNSWLDKSYTDVVCKRSTDGGLHWSSATSITNAINGGNYAFMDPTPVVDKKTGKIYVFFTRWLKGSNNAGAVNNVAYMSESSDNGVTWTTPVDISSQILAQGMTSSGFGPGHGIMIQEGKYAGRMVLITRQYNGSSNVGYAIYSDDNGKTWTCGSSTTGGEAQIAEAGLNRLYMNIRRGAARYTSTSVDGGKTWSTAVEDGSLPVVDGGCQASVIGVGDDMVFYCGPSSGPASNGHDNRYGLKLYRSAVSGVSWSRSQLLYEMASGYSDMTVLQDGSLAIIFEAGSEKGFIKQSNRPAGWMRLDFLVLPKEVTDYDYWF